MKTILTDADKRDLLSKWDTNVLLDLIDSVEAKIIERIGEAVAWKEYTLDGTSYYLVYSKQCNATQQPLYAIPFIEVEE